MSSAGRGEGDLGDNGDGEDGGDGGDDEDGGDVGNNLDPHHPLCILRLDLLEASISSEPVDSQPPLASNTHHCVT